MMLYAKQLGEGNAETILFIPGFVGSHEVWDEQFQSLKDQYHLILIDALGFGHSAKPDIAYSLEEHTNAIREMVEKFQVTRLHIVGHSMGTLLALAYCYRFSASVVSLALLSMPFFENEQAAREGVKKSSLFNRLLAMDTPLAHAACTVMCHLRPLLLPIMPYVVRGVPALVAKDSIRHTWQSYSRTLQHIIFQASTRQWIEAARQPVLLLHGTEDKTAPLANVRNAAQHFANGRLLEIEKAGHDFIFTHSRLLVSELRKFFPAFRSDAGSPESI